MFITKKFLRRRTLLRGLGAAMALPFFDAMVPALTPLAKAAANPRLRFGVTYFPNGAIMQQFTPAATEQNRRGFRIHAHPQAARAISRASCSS